jgi:hypothetical protein
MDPQQFQNYIAEPIFILVPALWIISVVLRQTPRVPDWVIPYVLLVLGIVGSLSILIELSIPLRITQGVLVAGVAILGNKVAKDAMKNIFDNGKGGKAK